MPTTRAPVAAAWQVRISAVALFLLAASNGNPAWWSSGVHLALIAPVVILARGPHNLIVEALKRSNRAIFLCLLAYIACNVTSAIATPTFETWQAVLFRCVIPLLTYLMFVGLILRQKDLELLLVGLALGVAFMFTRGAIAFVSEHGMPDLRLLYWARFDSEKIGGYSAATLGNVTQMGLYIALAVPPFMLCLLHPELSIGKKLIFLTVIGLGIFNLLICGARTGFVILGVATVIIVFTRGATTAVVALSVMALATLSLAPFWTSFIDEQFLNRFIPALATVGFDNSADERLQSIEIGWETFMAHPLFGVGPDMSPYHNAFFYPHQSIVHQFSELGIIGGTVFCIFNVVLFVQFWTALHQSRSASSQLPAAIWLIGPTLWLSYGLIGGIAFNAGFSIVWIGTASAMLALKGASVIADQSIVRRAPRAASYR